MRTRTTAPLLAITGFLALSARAPAGDWAMCAEMLRAKITDPYPPGPSGLLAQMPDPSGRMSRAEPDALAAVLLATARG